MHPAFSVIAFTTLSGLGYGLWIWTALSLLSIRGSHSATMHFMLLVAAVVPVAAGLVSSTLHLGKPMRAWRAFGQWRTSWLSREGLLAVACFVPWAVLVGRTFAGPRSLGFVEPVMLALIVALSLATLVCTAMIYASLKPIPAWTHRAVVPVYLGFALLTGGLTCLAVVSVAEEPGELRLLFLLLLSVALAIGKRRYWRDIDRGAMPASRASALGLPEDRVATVFERPHTEANYLTTEMGYVLARRHARKLRRIATMSFGWIPAGACVACLLLPAIAMPVLVLAAVSALLGTVVERWLFFAEARHMVMLYY